MAALLYYPDPLHPAQTYYFRLKKEDLVGIALKEILRELKNEDVLNGVQEEDLLVYAPLDLPPDPSETLYQRSRDWLKTRREASHAVRTNIRCRTAFPSAFDTDSEELLVNILIATNEVLGDLDISEEDLREKHSAEKEFLARYERFSTAIHASPEKAVSSSDGIRKAITNEKAPIICGRPAESTGPHTTLFNKHIAEFAQDIRDLKTCTIVPEHDLLVECHEYIDKAVGFYSSNEWHDRDYYVKKYLRKMLPDVNWQWDYPLPDGSGCGVVACGGFNCAYTIAVWKNESGIRGDPSLQATIFYWHFIREKMGRVLRKSCLPMLLIAIAANKFEVSAAVWTDSILVDKLVSEELVLGAHQSANILRFTRIVISLRKALDGLKTHYQHLAEERVAGNPVLKFTPLCPSPTPLSPEDTAFVDSIKFRGVYDALRARPLFIGEREENNGLSKVIIKFTPTYNQEAHNLLASSGFGPRLHGCIPIKGCDLLMVVADFVDGLNYTKNCPQLPPALHQSLTDAVDLLHRHGWVFGDLRGPNIIATQDETHALLIDFDIVGRHDRDRYPTTLNNTFRWPPDVKRYGIMKKEHDLVWLERLRTGEDISD